jgi:hypothetical protein
LKKINKFFFKSKINFYFYIKNIKKYIHTHNQNTQDTQTIKKYKMMVPPGHFPGPGPNNQSRPPMGQMGSGTMPPGHFPGPGLINPSLAPMGQMGPGMMMPPYPSQHPSHHPFALGAHPGSGPGPHYIIRSLVGQSNPPTMYTQSSVSTTKEDKEVKDLIITVSVFEALTIIAIVIFMLFNKHAKVGDDFFYRPFYYFFSFWFILLFILNTVFTVKLSKSMKYKKNGGAIILTSLTYVTLLVLFFIILRCRSSLTPIKRKTLVTFRLPYMD